MNGVHESFGKFICTNTEKIQSFKIQDVSSYTVLVFPLVFLGEIITR